MRTSAYCLFLLSCLFGSNSAAPAIISKGVSYFVKSLVADRASQVATSVGKKIDVKTGNDISVGDVAMMDVSMVKIVEPNEERSRVTKYLNNRAEYHLKFLKATNLMNLKKSNEETVQSALNEITGIYIVLNETDTATAEVLLTAQPCLLSKNDHYFSQIPDPCKSIAKESFSKIIERFETMESLKKKIGPPIRISAEWDSHWRQIVMFLDPFEDVLEKGDQASWTKIKELVRSQRFI